MFTDSWEECLDLSEKEFRSAWSNVLNRQYGRMYKRMKRDEIREDNETLSDAPEHSSSEEEDNFFLCD